MRHENCEQLIVQSGHHPERGVHVYHVRILEELQLGVSGKQQRGVIGATRYFTAEKW